MRRDFGHVHMGHVPVGGYQQPHFVSERGNFPVPSLPVPYRFAKSLLENDDPVYAATATVLNREQENEFAGIELGNPDLPTAEHREVIKQALRENRVVILTAELGAGKSTQTPQLALEAGFSKVVQTQPRRIAAYGVAARIDEELTATLGPERAKGMAACRTAELSTVTDRARIIIQTDGIEAVQQLNDKTFAPGELHVIDEVHEWNINIELTIAIAKRKLLEDTNARFLITSGTMPAHELADYFSEVTGKITPVIEVPGRRFALEKLEKPHSHVLEEVLQSIDELPDKDILVFVAGKREISDTIDGIYAALPAAKRGKIAVLPLHARLTKEEQEQVIRPYNGQKIIVSTNVAQTSLTIPGIGVVIDSGDERHIELDDEGVQGIGKHPASQADCDQRAGRTSRTEEGGRYILTKYTADSEYVPYINRPRYGQPEILRTDIDRTVLRTAAVGIDCEELDFFNAVSPEVVERSKTALFNLGALDEAGNITPLGRQMNVFGVRPSSARMLCEVADASPMVRAQLAAMTASLEVGGLPYFAHDAGKSWKQMTNEKSSDLFAQLDLFLASQNMTDAELRMNDLDVKNIRDAQLLYRKILRRSGTEIADLKPPSEEEREELKRAIYAGLIDWVYAYAGEDQYERVSQSADFTAREISRRSVVTGQNRLVVGSPYRVEFMHRGMPSTVHIIENVTVLDDPRILGKVAASHLISWEPARQVWRDGRYVEVMHKIFNGVIYLGEDKEVAASVTPENQQKVLEVLLETPGPAQQKLRKVKKELEELTHLTQVEIPQFTQDMLISLLQEAIGNGPLEQTRIDNRLREIVEERGIVLDKFVKAADRQKIRENSPALITVGSIELPITYRKGHPVVMHVTDDQIDACEDDVRLPDGREVLFVHDRKVWSISKLRESLSVAALQ